LVKSSHVPIVSPMDPSIVCPRCNKEEYEEAVKRHKKLPFAGICENCGSAAYYRY